MPLNGQVRAAVVTVHDDTVVVFPFLDMESRMMMLSGEAASPHQGIEPGGGISSWDEDALPLLSLLFPLHRNAVGGVLGRNAQEAGQEPGPDLLQADQAHA